MQEEGLQTGHFLFVVDLAAQLTDHFALQPPVLNGLSASPLAKIDMIGVMGIHAVPRVVVIS